ncbi:MAG: SMP-30/gluconolactonase/LRE family protein [Armatimonadetes bacterium]|nr:SMP-30/gluconolactonase/LRE family protein [Armatimonadota bacterium]
MRKEVSPLVGVVLILAALATVQGLYWRGLLIEEKLGSPRSGGGGGGGAEASLPTGLPDVIVETVAGGDDGGHRDGLAMEALFDGPAAVAAARDGALYVADSRNHVIRMISPVGRVSTVAGRAGTSGYADGVGADARLSAPAGVAWRPDGSLVVADTGNHRLRILRSDGTVSTYAGAATPTDDLGRELGGYRDGPAAQAQFRYPVGLAVDRSGAVYVADAGNGCVRRISPDGEVTTLPVAGEASLQNPTEVCLTSDGTLWVADTAAHGLWTGPKAGPLTPWPGDATGPGEGFAPAGIVAVQGASGGERLYLADSAGGCLWRIDGAGLAPIAGEQDSVDSFRDGGGDVARFNRPAGLTCGPAGTFYVADFGNERIRRVIPPRAAKERD